MMPLASLVRWLYLPPALHGHTTHKAHQLADSHTKHPRIRGINANLVHLRSRTKCPFQEPNCNRRGDTFLFDGIFDGIYFLRTKNIKHLH